MDEGKKKCKKYLNKKKFALFKIILIILFFFTNNKINNKFYDKIKYRNLNINKYKETIILEDEGFLELFENKDNSNEIEINNRKIFKSEILILLIPGGSYAYHGKPETLPVAKKFFSFGFSSAILYYSVYPKCYPEMYNQGLQAIKILSSRFKKIILIGFSAGGHLAGLLGTTKREKLYNAAGMILCYPVISLYQKAHNRSRSNFFGNYTENNVKNQKLFSIEKRVNSETLPTFIWTIKNDKIVPYENTLYMIEKLKKYNVIFESKIYEKGRHGMALADNTAIRRNIKEFKNEEIAKWVYLACNFIEKIIKNE